ncbi:MAG TPA: hypothetical protein VHL77_02905, partial [Ferruginibacter sp.]|nr:hypothetical protein [Ferruginibacter sp.]
NIACADANTGGTESISTTLTAGVTYLIRVYDFQAGTPANPTFTIAVTGPAIFYSKSTGNLNLTTSWVTNNDGTGNNPLNFTAPNQTFNIINNATPTIGAAWTVSGSGSKIVLGNGTNPINFTIPSGFAVTGTIDVAANATLTIQNAVNPTLGTIGASSTIDYALASGSQTVIPRADYKNLSISGGGTKTIASATTIANTLNLNAGTLSNGANLTVSDGGTVNRYEGTLSANPTYGNTTGVNVNYLGANDIASATGSTPLITPASGKVKDLTINLSNSAKTVNTSTGTGATISGNVFITSGTLALGNSLTVGGNWSNAGTFTPGLNQVTFNGTSGSQSYTRTGTGSFYNLNLNNSNGLSLNNDLTVSNILKFTIGKIITGTNKVISTGSIVTAGTGTGWVVGNLQKPITAAGAKTFEIGGSNFYRPVTLDFTSFSAAGDIVASVTQADGNHPNLGTSTLDATKTVKRYFTLTNNTVAGTYNAVFNFDASDVPVGANPLNFIIGKYSSGWTYPTVGTRTATSTQLTGATSFSDFVIGELSSW